MTEHERGDMNSATELRAQSRRLRAAAIAETDPVRRRSLARAALAAALSAAEIERDRVDVAAGAAASCAMADCLQPGRSPMADPDRLWAGTSRIGHA
jgi:hypothetical protein